MATAEIIRDASAAITENAAPIMGSAIQGSTQAFGATPNSLRAPTPVFFAPHQHSGLAAYWGVLLRGVVRSFFAPLAGSPATLTRSAEERLSIAWDRLSLDLMRIASLKPNWDDEGADQIPQTAVKNAAVVLSLARAAIFRAAPGQASVPSLLPALDGGVVLKWVQGPKELKCTVRADLVEVVRWKSPENYESEGFWEIPVQRVAEHFQWLLR